VILLLPKKILLLKLLKFRKLLKFLFSPLVPLLP